MWIIWPFIREKEEPKIEDIVKKLWKILICQKRLKKPNGSRRNCLRRDSKRQSGNTCSRRTSSVSTEEVIEPEAVEETAQEELGLESDELETIPRVGKFLKRREPRNWRRTSDWAVEEELPQVEETKQAGKIWPQFRTDWCSFECLLCQLPFWWRILRRIGRTAHHERRLVCKSLRGLNRRTTLWSKLEMLAWRAPSNIIEKLVELYEKDGNYDVTNRFQDGLTVTLVGVNGCWENNFYREIGSSPSDCKKVKCWLGAILKGRRCPASRMGPSCGCSCQTDPKRLIQQVWYLMGWNVLQLEAEHILMIDTAGRLQNKGQPFMAELERLSHIKRVVPEAPHETFLHSMLQLTERLVS